MEQPNLQQIRAAVAQDPLNAELRYLLGAELAQQKDYEAAVVELTTALGINPALHFARFQLGLLYLTMAQPQRSMDIWAPLEALDDAAALKHFKRGLEALIRDDFRSCVELLERGIALNTENAPLNHDMNLVIASVAEAVGAAAPVVAAAPAVAPAPAPAPVRTDFSLYGETSNTKH
jgi:tetratricopeptide (TPR) repeat protein